MHGERGMWNNDRLPHLHIVILKLHDPLRSVRALLRAHDTDTQKHAHNNRKTNPSLPYASPPSLGTPRRVPALILRQSASLEPRFFSSAVIFGKSAAESMPSGADGIPSKSDPMPTWSMPAIFTMWSMCSIRSLNGGRGIFAAHALSIASSWTYVNRLPSAFAFSSAAFSAASRSGFC